MSAHRFSTPLSRDLFAIVADAGLAEAELFKNRPRLSQEEAERNRRAAIHDELYSEGRLHRNTYPNRKGP